MAELLCAVCGVVLRSTLATRLPASWGDPADALCAGDAADRSERDARSTQDLIDKGKT